MTGTLKFLPRIFRHRGLPTQFIFFITARCNLKCGHCFYAENLNNRAKEELSIEEIEKISKGMGRLLWFSMTGGEPFIRKDIARIAEIFYKNNSFSYLTITTNGILRSSIIPSVAEMCGTCKDANILVSVSFDGLERTHNKIRNTADGFKLALATIRELKELKKEYKNLNVATATTCTAENQDEMRDLALFLKNEVKPDNMVVNIVRGKPCSGPLGKVNLKNYFDFVKVQEDGLASGGLGYYGFFGKTLLKKKESLQKRIIATVFDENKYVIPCLAGDISCVMSETGDVYPCEILNEKMGNIRDAGYVFKDVWYSERSENIRKFIRKTKCYCTYECAVTTNILFNPGQLVKMFFGPKKQKETKWQR